MIGLDTNILLRAVTQDDPHLAPVASRLLAELTPENPGYINIAVLAEFAWTLARRYKAGRDDVMVAIEALLESSAYMIADREAVVDTLEIMAAEPLDFADALIAALNRRAGCEVTWTFDRKTGRSPLFDDTMVGNV